MMGTYRITAPDGGVYEITAPDDATEDQVLAYAQQNFGQVAPSRWSDPVPVATSAIPTDSFDPTIGMTGFEKFAAGMGRSAVETGRGIKQLGMAAADAIPGVDLSGSRAAYAETLADARRLDAPLMATGAGMAGNIVGGALQAAIPVGGAGATLTRAAGRAAPYIGAATRGAAYAGLQPVIGDESRATNAALGGAFGAGGQGLASAASKGAASAKAALAGPVRDSINAARAAGIPLNVSQVTNSPMLRYLSSASSRLPFAGGGAAAARQHAAFNRAVGKTFGVDATALTDDVMAQARTGIGAVYDDVFSRNPVAMNPGDSMKMQGIVAAAQRDMTAENSAIVQRQAQRIADEFLSGPMTGARYQNLRGELAELSKGNNVVGSAVGKLRTVLDDAAHRSVGKADAAALKKANSMWANMRTAEDALKQVNGGAAGNVRPASLWPLVRKGSTKEMRELAKVGQNVMRQQLPDSGTADRMLAQNLLGLGAGGAALSSDNPWVQAAGAGLIAGRAANSPMVARGLLAAQPAAVVTKQGLARIAQAAPYALPAAAHAQMQPEAAPLEINVVGGTVGPALTAAEIEELRRTGLLRGAAYP